MKIMDCRHRYSSPYGTFFICYRAYRSDKEYNDTPICPYDGRLPIRECEYAEVNYE